LPSFTLDTNCIIDIDENRPAARHVRALADAHAAGRASVAVGAIAASERQRGGRLITNFQEFQQRLAGLQLGHLEILAPMLYFDVSFWDRALWATTEMEAFERRIHDTLFPNVEFLWRDYALAHGLDVNATPAAWRWRNVKCDVQAIWTHVYYHRDVFVTSDDNYHNHSAELIALGVGLVVAPENAVALLP
jgi:hypothetical protein